MSRTRPRQNPFKFNDSVKSCLKPDLDKALPNSKTLSKSMTLATHSISRSQVTSQHCTQISLDIKTDLCRHQGSPYSWIRAIIFKSMLISSESMGRTCISLVSRTGKWPLKDSDTNKHIEPHGTRLQVKLTFVLQVPAYRVTQGRRTSWVALRPESNTLTFVLRDYRLFRLSQSGGFCRHLKMCLPKWVIRDETYRVSRLFRIRKDALNS